MIIKKRNLRGKVVKEEPKKVEAQVSNAQISEIENIEQRPVVEEVVQEISQPEVSQEPEIDFLIFSASSCALETRFLSSILRYPRLLEPRLRS